MLLTAGTTVSYTTHTYNQINWIFGFHLDQEVDNYRYNRYSQISVSIDSYTSMMTSFSKYSRLSDYRA